MKIDKPVKRTRTKQPRLYVWVMLSRAAAYHSWTIWSSRSQTRYSREELQAVESVMGRGNVRIVRVEVPVKGRKAR